LDIGKGGCDETRRKKRVTGTNISEEVPAMSGVKERKENAGPRIIEDV